MSARVTVTLPEPMLERLDLIAQAEGLTRSDVVREAASSYLSQRDRKSALSERDTAIQEDLAWLENIAQHVPVSTPQSSDLLHEIRNGAGGAGEPVRHETPDWDTPK